MTALDILMLLVIGGGAVFGFARGFVQEVLSLFSWVLAIMAVRLFLAPLSDLIGVWLGGSGGAAILSFALLFGAGMLGGKMLARRAGRSSRASILGPVDRVLGGGFGAAKGLVMATVVFLGFSLVYNMVFGLKAERPEWMTSARSYPLLDASGKAMSQFAQYSSGAESAASAVQQSDPEPE